MSTNKTKQGFEVMGTVRFADGSVAVGLKVSAFDRDLRSEQLLGEARTDKNGSYQIKYTHVVIAPNEKGAADILLRVFRARKMLYETPIDAIVFNAPATAVIDIDLTANDPKAESEYERILRIVTPLLDGVALDALREDGQTRDLTFLVHETGLYDDQLAHFGVAHKLASAHEIMPEFFYALLAENTLLKANLISATGARFVIDFATELQPLFYDIVLLPDATVIAAVKKAVKNRLVPQSLLQQLPRIVKQLAGSRPQAQAYVSEQRPKDLFQQLERFLVAGKQEQVLAILQQDSFGDLPGLLQRLHAAAAFTDTATATAAATSVALSEVLGYDQQIIERIVELQGINRPENVRNLARLNRRDWTRLLREIAPPVNVGNRPMRKKLIDLHASALVRKLEQQFPTTAFAAQLERDTTAFPAERRQLLELLEDYPELELATANIPLLLRNKQAATAAPATPAATAAQEAALATQRVFKIAPNFAKTKALREHGIHSAAGIHAMGETRFVNAFARKGSFNAAEARTAYRKATDIHTASALLAGELQAAAGAMNVTALANTVPPAQLEAVTRDYPNLKSLFQLADYCACQECRSVHSAAAYVVDTLQFLKNRLVVDTTVPGPSVNVEIAKDVLFERRPDLGDTDLSCDNTNTPLPYIDVVCELLEEAVAPDPGIAFSGAVDSGVISPALLAALQSNGFTLADKAVVYDADLSGNRVVRDEKVVCKLAPAGSPTDWLVRRLRQTYDKPEELLAAPQYVNTAAYVVLADSSFAFTLPFDLYHQESRAYFVQFDVSRADLMRALRTVAAPQAPEIAAEAFGLSDKERQLIVTPDAAHQSTYWNSGATPPVDLLKIVDTFLTKSELTYSDLQDLLTRGWVNPGGTMFIRYLDNSCDLTKQEIENLDDAALDRLHRFIRLWKKIGWTSRALDGAIRAARIGNGVLDDSCLMRLQQIGELHVRLKLPHEELCNFYDVIPGAEDNSRYAQVFLNATANGTVNDDFRPENLRQNELNEQTTPGSGKKIAVYKDYIALCIGVPSADCDRLVNSLGTTAILSAVNIARIYALSLLGRTLSLGSAELLILTGLIGIDVFASPGETLRFLDKQEKVRTSGATPAQLQYLLIHDAENLNERVLSDDAVANLLRALQRVYHAASEEYRSPFNPAATADENKSAVKNLLARLPKDPMAGLPGFSTSELSLLLSIMDGAWMAPSTTPALTPAQFLDQKLAGYIDTAPIQAALAALEVAAPPKETERNALIETLSAALSQYFFMAAKKALLTSQIVQTFKWDDDVATTVLNLGRLKQPAAAGNRVLLDLLTDDVLIQMVNTPPELPVINPVDFGHQYRAFRLLHKISLFLATSRLSANAIDWMLKNNTALGWMELDNLMYWDDVAPVPFNAWEQVHDVLQMVATYPPIADPSDATRPFTVFGVFNLVQAPGTTTSEVLAYLAQLTAWDLDTLIALDVHFGFSAIDLAPYRLPESYLQLEVAVQLLRKLGLALPSALSVAKPKLSPPDAALMRQALKARYAQSDWLGVLKNVQDSLRQQKRDGLAAYLLAVNPDMKSTDDLYDYFLIDVEMCSCMPTSRIVQAHATIQLFVQRCLMGLEPRSVANIKQDAAWGQWKWMANFRLWEANRKVFLYPENWIEPELRDDKSELFSDMENVLQQDALTDQAVEAAATGYLEQLDDIAQLDVMATYYQTDIATMHVFARTKGGDPAIYYYRQLRQERYWTPWEKLNIDITGDHLIAFDRNSRLTLAWPVFTSEPDPNSKSTIPSSSQQGQPVSMDKPAKRWRIQLAVSERTGKRWLPKIVSKGSIGETAVYSPQLNSRVDLFRFFVWKLGAGQAITCASDGRYYGSFALTGCKGYPEANQAAGGYEMRFLPEFKDALTLNGRFAEWGIDQADDLAIKTIFNLASFDSIVNSTPGSFKVTYPMQMSVLDWVALWLQLYQYSAANSISVDPKRGKTPHIPLGTLMPYFYGDVSRSYIIIPGFYETKARDPKHRIEKTFSAIHLFVTDAIALLVKYLQIYQQDPAHDLNNLVQQLVADDEYIRLKKEFAVYRSLQYGLKFKNFYHPLLCFLRATFYREGIAGLMQRDVQLKDTGFDFASVYNPTALVVRPYPREDVDFEKDGAYSSYNWELFFHLPFEIAMRLNQDQRFEEARNWFHYIFNPVGATDAPAPQKFWITKPFFQTPVADYLSQRIDNILYVVAADPSGATITELKASVADWRSKPFSPHVIARSRPVAYQLAVVMKYIQNLVDWGDKLFHQFTRESVTQATQMYILADKLLGPKPRIVPAAISPPVQSYNQLEAKVDLFGNALLDLENMIPDLDLLPQGGAELPPAPIEVTSLYFCIPPNEKMLQYWDTVADRLFKIRHCQNIDGVESILALFSPPIDPGALVRATAAGMDVSAFLAGLGAPLPNYRFNVMSQKAAELVQQVGSLGNSLLQALEKRDAESLARLHSQQEVTVLGSVRAVKLAAIAEAQGTVDGLIKSRQVTEERKNYYADQSYMNAGEIAGASLSVVALVTETASQIAHLGASVVQAIPQVEVGGAGAFGSPLFTVSVGGQTLGPAAVSAADVLSIIAHASDRGAAMALTQGGYQRRQDEWDFQVRLADKELTQIDQQILTANLHLEMLSKDLATHDIQIDNANQTDLFMRSKYTNRELYQWMVGQVSSVYFRAYQLAFDVAKKAERCFGYELGTDATFLSFGYWDSLKNGLMSAEALHHDIKRMEAAYLDQNRREYELTKHVSLLHLDPQTLLQLKNTGKCLVQVPESTFDLDHPGHYMRRLKSVSLSIPCVAGPYTSVSCKLSQISNRYRNSTALRQGVATDKEKYQEQSGNDERFAYNLGAIQSIATSSAQTDSGMFELNFRDDRYLPFEGTGAIAIWQLELPTAIAQVDYQTISDVILHLRYTARDGGSAFKNCVEGGLRESLNEMALIDNRSGLYQAYNLRQQFPNEWFQLKQSQSTQITLGAQYLPVLAQNHAPDIDHVTWFARVDGSPVSYVISINATASTLNRNPGLADLCVGDSAVVVPGTPFTVSAADTNDLEELTMMIHYNLIS